MTTNPYQFTGALLDGLGANLHTPRLPDESDDAYRQRIIAAANAPHDEQTLKERGR